MAQLPRVPASTTGPPAAPVRAFLIADLRGYTRFSDRHGDEAAARLTGRFAAVAGEVVARHSGSVVDLRGDEVLAVFDSPREAVRAAVALQVAIVSEAGDDPELRLEAGMGIDAGEAATIEGGFRARALNMAARLCARARPGEILVTPELAHLAGPVEGVVYEDRGPVHLKGISRPVRLQAVMTVPASGVAGASAQGTASALGTLEFRVLGPLELTQGGRPVELGARQQRLLLAHLLLEANRVVPVEQLVERIWGEGPPRDPRGAIQNAVSRLRAALGGERIEGREPGYVLHVEPDEVDVLRFERLLRRARRQLAIDPREGAAIFEEALSLWRGTPLADLADAPSLAGEIARLEELRVAALEDLIGARLALGEHAETIPELERLLAAHPLRERLWGHLLLALYRAGRRGEALAAFERARGLLASTLGIDPSAELRELHERIRADDPGLELRGQPLRSYRLIEQIGEGGLGVVWRAFDPGVGRDVAVKQIRSELAEDPSFVRRFAQEAQIVARIEHPHVVPLYDYWRDGSGAYLVMRLMRGGSLAETLTGESLRMEAVTAVTDHIASALSAAHRLNVLHRDVKPENVLLDEDGNAYLSDFALADDLAYGRSASASEREYRAPELGRGEPATSRSDIYALTVLVSAMLGRTGQKIPPHVEALIAKGTANDPSQRFGDARELADGLRAAIEARPAATAAAERPQARGEARNPYKGLRPFGEADAADFYGRDALVERLVARVREDPTRLLAVVGPSGSGKSSVVRAGLLPALRRGAIPGSERWFYADLLPGPRPLEELEAALLRVAVNPPASLIEQLERDERGLARAVERVLPGEGGELLLLIDQFEEVFTLVEEEPLRQAFLEGLVAAVTDPRSRLRVVVTLRADFYDRPLGYPGLAEVVRAGTETVVPLSAEELERAIVGPAESVGSTPERTLIAEVVGDVTDQPGALPLMQYALTETFDRSPPGLLTLEAYRETGGVRGALAKRAEQLYTELDDAGREAARQLFLRLVTIGEGLEDARRLVRRSELASLEVDPRAMEAVIEAFGRHRLLSFDRDPDTRGPTVEVAHEALLREWGRLRGWIDAAREDVIVHRRLAAEAEEWERAGRDPSFLLRGSRLAQFEAWAETTGLALAAAERGYLQESLRARRAEVAAEEARLARERALERRSVIRMRALVGVLTVAALVASALTVFAFNEQGRAEREASRAQREGRLATARELAAAATANLTVDPERSILLALQALETTEQDGTFLPEAVQALHDAVAADRLLFTLEHPSTANVEWSPDGRLLATGGSAAGKEQTDVLLWDAGTGAKVRTLSGHAADIEELAFSPDSTRLVTNSQDNQMFVWDTRTGERLLTVPLETGAGANFSPDGRRLVVGGSAPAHVSVLVVDATTGEVLRTVVTADDVGLPVYSPDGKLIAVPLGEVVSFYDAESFSEVLTVQVEFGFAIVYSPDGTRFATQASGGVGVYDAQTGDVVLRIPGSAVGLDWSADGRLIATGDNDGTARIWDAATGEEVLRLAGHSGGVALVSFSPDGTRLLTGGTDATARVWDITPTATAEWLGAHEPPSRDSVAFSPDGRSLLTGGWCRGWLWDTGTRTRIRAIPDACGPAAFGPGGATIARMTCPDFDCAVGLIKILDAATGQELQGIDAVPSWPASVAFSPDGKLIATAGIRPTVWDASSGEAILDELGEPGRWTTDVAFSPDGTALAGITELATLFLWDAASGDELLRMQAQGGFGAAVAFAPDGSRLATAGGDGATVWSLSGERLASMTGSGRLANVAFSADGERIATGGADGTARIWDVATGEQLLVLKGHAGTVIDVAFSPDGTRLATVGEDGTLRVYVLPIDELVGIARARLSRGLLDEECRQYLHLPACPPSTSPTPAPPTQPPVTPGGGPEGAYRVSISPDELPAPLLEPEDWYAGDYTLSLVGGTWRLHLARTLLPRSDFFFGDVWSGPYTVSGDRIVFLMETGGEPGCLGGELSGRWALTDDFAISFAGMAWPATDPCHSFQLTGDPGETKDAWLRTVFESRPWTRIP